MLHSHRHHCYSLQDDQVLGLILKTKNNHELRNTKIRKRELYTL